MKKVILLFVFGALTLSCSSDDSGPSLATSPQAKAQYDDSSFGVYKGVFVGSTGTVLVNIYNDGAAEAIVTIDGTSKTYTAPGKIAEDFAIEGLQFVNGSNTFAFSVDGDGGNPYISEISITGHAGARMTVLKEYSNSLCKCYVGTYSGDDSGVFNIVTEGDIVDGVAFSHDGGAFNTDGTLSGTNIVGFFEGGGFTGTLNGNSMSGTWQNNISETGTWHGSRKL